MKKILLTLMISPFLAFGQGTVDFEDVTLPTSYQDGSFDVGGTTYTYGHSRDHDGYPIDGAGLLLRRASDSYFEWTSNNGVGQVTFEYRKAYTGGSIRQLELLVNGTQVALSPEFGGGSGEQADIYTFTHAVNEDGAVTIKIKNEGNATQNKQIVIDNVVWTAFDATQVCEAPTDLAVTNITESSADVSWTAGGTETEWIVVYGPTGFDITDYDSNADVTELTVTAPAATLSDLEEGTGYDVYVIAICGTDLESNAVNTTFTTETTSVPTCDAPTGLTVDNISETGADVTWTAGGTETEWLVVYGPTGFDINDYASNADVEEVTVTAPETTLSGLTDGEKYDVYVIAKCADDLYSDELGPETFTTKTSSIDKQLFESFSFYPNPIQNVINLKSGSNIEYVQVYDMLGKNVIEVAPNALSVELNTSKLQKGVYIMKVTIKGTQETFRIVKK